LPVVLDWLLVELAPAPPEGVVPAGVVAPVGALAPPLVPVAALVSVVALVLVLLDEEVLVVVAVVTGPATALVGTVNPGAPAVLVLPEPPPPQAARQIVAASVAPTRATGRSVLARDVILP
jgi:hypothetical protein